MLENESFYLHGLLIKIFARSFHFIVQLHFFNFNFLSSTVKVMSYFNKKYTLLDQILKFSTSKFKLKKTNLKYKLKTMLQNLSCILELPWVYTSYLAAASFLLELFFFPYILLVQLSFFLSVSPSNHLEYFSPVFC